jgi:hypothetical protein
MSRTVPPTKPEPKRNLMMAQMNGLPPGKLKWPGHRAVIRFLRDLRS